MTQACANIFFGHALKRSTSAPSLLHVLPVLCLPCFRCISFLCSLVSCAPSSHPVNIDLCHLFPICFFPCALFHALNLLLICTFPSARSHDGSRAALPRSAVCVSSLLSVCTLFCSAEREQQCFSVSVCQTFSR